MAFVLFVARKNVKVREGADSEGLERGRGNHTVDRTLQNFDLQWIATSESVTLTTHSMPLLRGGGTFGSDPVYGFRCT